MYSKCTPGSGHPKLAMHIYALVPYPLFNFDRVYISDILVNVLKHFQEVYELAVWTGTFQMFPSISQK